jgi:hypothetical protein
MQPFDYAAPGELFCALSISRRSRVTYRRFDSAAKAIRFAIEELGADGLRAATLEVNERRLNGVDIRRLYDDAGYPLKRVTAKVRARTADAGKVAAA